MLDALAPFLILGLFALSAYFFMRRKEPIVCPKCQSTNVKQFRKEFKELQKEKGNTFFDTGTTLAVYVEAEYRCNNCKHEWKRVERD